MACYESVGGSGGEECSSALLLDSAQSYSDCCEVEEGMNGTRMYSVDQQQCEPCGRSLGQGGGVEEHTLTK